MRQVNGDIRRGSTRDMRGWAPVSGNIQDGIDSQGEENSRFKTRPRRCDATPSMRRPRRCDQTRPRRCDPVDDPVETHSYLPARPHIDSPSGFPPPRPYRIAYFLLPSAPFLHLISLYFIPIRCPRKPRGEGVALTTRVIDAYMQRT